MFRKYNWMGPPTHKQSIIDQNLTMQFRFMTTSESKTDEDKVCGGASL
jgi:hypothetical protein